MAFKEWAVIVEALGQGEQSLILRKGGIREGRGGFQVEHPEFLLFPTRFHQQAESVLPDAAGRLEGWQARCPDDQTVRFEYFGRVTDWRNMDSRETVGRLRGQHVWRDEVIEERFDWGRTQNLFAMMVRVYRLPGPVDLPMVPEYGGCKSWIELLEDVPIEGAEPVLSDAAFAVKRDRFLESVGNPPVCET